MVKTMNDSMITIIMIQELKVIMLKNTNYFILATYYYDLEQH